MVAVSHCAMCTYCKVHHSVNPASGYEQHACGDTLPSLYESVDEYVHNSICVRDFAILGR